MNEPAHISHWLREYLRKHEQVLRDMAAKEAAEGKFTRGLSRCIDLLDAERA